MYLIKYYENIKKKIIDFFKFLFFGFSAGIIGSFFSILIRMELTYPGIQILNGDGQFYNVIVTAHAFIMSFLKILKNIKIIKSFINFILNILGLQNASNGEMVEILFTYLTDDQLRTQKVLILNLGSKYILNKGYKPIFKFSTFTIKICKRFYVGGGDKILKGFSSSSFSLSSLNNKPIIIGFLNFRSIFIRNQPRLDIALKLGLLTPEQFVYLNENDLACLRTFNHNGFLYRHEFDPHIRFLALASGPNLVDINRYLVYPRYKFYTMDQIKNANKSKLTIEESKLKKMFQEKIKFTFDKGVTYPDYPVEVYEDWLSLITEVPSGSSYDKRLLDAGTDLRALSNSKRIQMILEKAPCGKVTRLEDLLPKSDIDSIEEYRLKNKIEE